MTAEDLRLIANGGAYTEVDPNNQLNAATATTLTITQLNRNASTYHYRDLTPISAGWFKGDIKVTLGDATGTGSISIGFSDTIGSYNSWVSGSVILVLQEADAIYWRPYIALREASISYTAFGELLSIGTQYYYTFGVYTSLSRYGTLVFQIFSDSGRTALLASISLARTASVTYDEFYAATSTNTGVNTYVSALVENITTPVTTAGVDLTTGVETDTGTGRLVVYADCIIATALNIANSETAKHVAIDEGADFFGDYTVSGVLNVTAFASGTANATMFEILAMTDAAADALASNNLQGITVFYATATTYYLKSHQSVGGADDFSTAGPTLNTNQPYSFTLNRSGTTLTLKVWNDLVLTNFAGTSQVGSTVTWTGRATTTYRYLMPVASTLNGAISRSSTFTLGGVQRLGNPPTTVTATKGAFSWAGTTATLTEQAQSINATKGAFSWAGKTSVLSLLIQSTKGAFGWTGKTVNLNTGGQVNTLPGAFGWAGKSSPLTYFVTATKGAFSWAGKTSLLGSTVTSLRTATLTKWDTATAKEIPDTGLTTVLYMLYDPINLKVFDFSDNTFKASASCVTPRGTMTERVLLNSVGTNLTPGVYDILLATTGLSGLYQEYLFYYGTTNHLDSNPVRFQDGIEYLGGLTVAENTTLVAVPTAAVNADAVWDEVLTKATHNIANSAGKIVRQLRGMTVHEGTAQAGGLNTITLDTGASATDHIYKECLVVILAGTAVGEAHHILSYNGTTKVAMVDQNWYVQPDATSDFILFGSSAHDTVETGSAQAAATTSITLNGTASATNDVYLDQMIFISSGTGVGQVRRITGYVGATKVATVDKVWVITPDSTSGYMLYPAVVFSADVKKMNAATVTGNGTSGDLWRGA